jgi:hypothetical protein
MKDIHITEEASSVNKEYRQSGWTNFTNLRTTPCCSRQARKQLSYATEDITAQREGGEETGLLTLGLTWTISILRCFSLIFT